MLPHKTALSPRPEKTPETTRSSEQPGQVNVLARQKIHRLLNEQDYSGAINLIYNEIHKGADEQVLAKEYLRAANGSISLAETLIDQGQCDKAAILLKTIQDSYPQSPELKQQISASPTQIDEKIGACTESLMEAGLVAYRSGQFTAAIDIWERVLEFDPQNQTAKDSIETTERQLLNLKALDIKD
jgi:tetratricopeptide (TPR) repeat protein